MRYKSGFTLVEMMVTLAIFTVLLSAIYYVMATGQNTFFTSNASVDVQQELRKFKESVIKDILQGREVTSNITTTFIPFVPAPALPLPPVLDNNISFDIPQTVTPTGDVNWQNITYVQVRNPALPPFTTPQIIRIENPPSNPAFPSRVVANNITALNFIRSPNEPHYITVNVTSQKQDIRGRLITQTENFGVKLRN